MMYINDIYQILNSKNHAIPDFNNNNQYSF